MLLGEVSKFSDKAHFKWILGIQSDEKMKLDWQLTTDSQENKVDLPI